MIVLTGKTRKLDSDGVNHTYKFKNELKLYQKPSWGKIR